MKFGENLKNFRKNNKMSQEELADKIGVTRQSVSKWEVGDAYPEMSNIVALCSIFKCNINDLINDNTADIDSFDADTKEGIVKFKKSHQKRMKGISKTIYILINITKTILFVVTVMLTIGCLILPFISKTFNIKDDKIEIFNKEYNYSIDGNMVTIDNHEFYVETKTDLNKFIKNHDRMFFIVSAEYILICEALLTGLICLGLNCLYKLYKNIYKGNTPFTIENEKLVKKACLFILTEMFLQKATALIYSFIVNIDLAIDFNIQDIIFILIGISIVYIFKYGRMIQADTKAKIYD